MKAMRSKPKKNETDSDSIEEYDEDDLDEELKLPKSMEGLSREEKKELLLFKREHTEREWEEEISRRAAIYERKLDYERLRRMTGATSAPSEPTKRVTPKKGGKMEVESEAEESEDQSEESDHMIADEVDEYNSVKSSEEDDLFDSDEEAEISKRPRVASDEEELEDNQNTASRKTSKVLGKRKNKPSSRRRRWSDSPAQESDEEAADSEVDDDEEEDRGEDSDDNLIGGDSDRHDYNLKSIKDSHRRVVDRDGAAASSNAQNKQSSAVVFDNLSQWKAHLEKQLQRDLPYKPNDDEPADHEDYRKLFRRRDDIIRTLHEPFFEQLMTGCFVRYLIGVVDKVQVYRMCEIIGIDRSKKTYRLPPLANGLVNETNVRLHLNNAGETKLFQKLDKVSNHSLLEHEIEFHLAGMKNHPEKSLPTKRDFRKLRQRHKQFSEHTYTHEDISHMVASKIGLNKLLTTEYSNAMAVLKRRLDEAVERGDQERQELLKKEIRKMEDITEQQRQVFQANAKKQSDINRRMRESNVVRDMDAGMRKRHEELEAVSKGILPNAISDPFIRRETRPKILWNTSEKLKKKKQEEAEKKDKPNLSSASPAKAANKKSRYAEEDRWAVSADVSFSEVRRRVTLRLGVDPFAACQATARDRYLRRVCSNLPPLGSAERERLRGSNKSLQDYILLLSKNGEASGGSAGEPLQT